MQSICTIGVEVAGDPHPHPIVTKLFRALGKGPHHPGHKQQESCNLQQVVERQRSGQTGRKDDNASLSAQFISSGFLRPTRQVALVILFGPPKWHRCLNLCDHRLRPATGLIEGLDRSQCSLFLSGGMKKDS